MPFTTPKSTAPRLGNRHILRRCSRCRRSPYSPRHHQGRPRTPNVPIESQSPNRPEIPRRSMRPPLITNAVCAQYHTAMPRNIVFNERRTNLLPLQARRTRWWAQCWEAPPGWCGEFSHPFLCRSSPSLLMCVGVELFGFCKELKAESERLKLNRAQSGGKNHLIFSVKFKQFLHIPDNCGCDAGYCNAVPRVTWVIAFDWRESPNVGGTEHLILGRIVPSGIHLTIRKVWWWFAFQ